MASSSGHITTIKPSQWQLSNSTEEGPWDVVGGFEKQHVSSTFGWECRFQAGGCSFKHYLFFSFAKGVTVCRFFPGSLRWQEAVVLGDLSTLIFPFKCCKTAQTANTTGWHPITVQSRPTADTVQPIQYFWLQFVLHTFKPLKQKSGDILYFSLHKSHKKTKTYNELILQTSIVSKAWYKTIKNTSMWYDAALHYHKQTHTHAHHICYKYSTACISQWLKIVPRKCIIYSRFSSVC